MSDMPQTPRWWTMRPHDVAALAGVIAVLCGLTWWLIQPTTIALQPLSTPSPSPSSMTVEIAATTIPSVSASPTPTPTPSVIAIHVVGAVKRPGLVVLAPGSRAEAAITAAGGFAESADQRTINLAQPLSDGQQVVVGAIGEPAPTPAQLAQPVGQPGGQPSSPSLGEGIININTATQIELEQLPGIGPKTAEAILAYRQEHGPFASVDHLEAVPGIGRKTVDGLKERARS